jgi:hypothetical protein
MGYAKGQSGNPAGRPKGSKNKRTKLIFDEIKRRGDIDLLDLLSEIVSARHCDLALRIQAANALAPYKHGRAPTRAYINPAIAMDVPQSVEEAEKYLGLVAKMVATGELDRQAGLEVAKLLESWVAVRAERDKQGGSTVMITITGGLPPLPMGPGDAGIIMPTLSPVPTAIDVTPVTPSAKGVEPPLSRADFAPAPAKDGGRKP